MSGESASLQGNAASRRRGEDVVDAAGAGGGGGGRGVLVSQ